MTLYRRNPADGRTERLAVAAGAAAAAAVGAVVWYLARLWLQREPLEDAGDGDGASTGRRIAAGEARPPVPGRGGEAVREGADREDAGAP